MEREQDATRVESCRTRANGYLTGDMALQATRRVCGIWKRVGLGVCDERGWQCLGEMLSWGWFAFGPCQSNEKYRSPSGRASTSRRGADGVEMAKSVVGVFVVVVVVHNVGLFGRVWLVCSATKHDQASWPPTT